MPKPGNQVFPEATVVVQQSLVQMQTKWGFPTKTAYLLSILRWTVSLTSTHQNCLSPFNPPMDSQLDQYVTLKLLHLQFCNNWTQPCVVCVWNDECCHTLPSLGSLFTKCGGGNFFLACQDLGRMFNNSFPTCTFFFFFKVEISSHTLISLFRSGSVHSG